MKWQENTLSQNTHAQGAEQGRDYGQSQQPTYGQYGPGAVVPSPVLSGSGSPNLSGRGDAGWGGFSDRMPLQSSGGNTFQNLGSEYLSEQVKNQYSPAEREIHRIIERSLNAAKSESIGDEFSKISSALNTAAITTVGVSFLAGGPEILIVAGIENRLANLANIGSVIAYSAALSMTPENHELSTKLASGVGSLIAGRIWPSTVSARVTSYGYGYASRTGYVAVNMTTIWGGSKGIIMDFAGAGIGAGGMTLLRNSSSAVNSSPMQ